MSSDGGKSAKRKQSGSTDADTDKKAKQPHRAQQLSRPAWELDPTFKEWLQPVAGNEAEAFCRCCSFESASDITVLKNHAKGNKHTQNVKCLAANQISVTMNKAVVSFKWPSLCVHSSCTWNSLVFKCIVLACDFSSCFSTCNQSINQSIVKKQ